VHGHVGPALPLSAAGTAGIDGETAALYGAGGGGAGGYGAVVTGAGTNNLISGTIMGGNGGAGGLSLQNAGGDGGSGGIGLLFTDASLPTTVTVTGVIQGGNGGEGGSGGTIFPMPGAPGAGGAGLVGSNLSITNSGTISGGAGAPGIRLKGGSNSLTMASGSVLNGGVALETGTLAIAQPTDTTIIFSGHGNISKTGAGRLTGTLPQSSGSFGSFSGEVRILEGGFELVGPLYVSLPFLPPENYVNATGISAIIEGTTAELNIQTLEYRVGGVSLRSGSITGSGVLATRSDFDMQSGSVSVNLGGAGGLTKATGGTVTLSGNNTYTGGTTINAGTLSVGADVNLGTDGLTFNGGMLRTTGSFASSRAVALPGTGTFDIVGSTVLGLGGVISGPGRLLKEGTGTLTLAGANSFTGLTAINSGRLILSGGSALIDATDVAVATGATLELATAETIGSLAGAGNVVLNGALTAGGSNTSTTFSGNMTGVGGYTKTGTGTMTLTGSGSYTGATTVSGGNLRVNGSLGASAVTVGNGATLSGSGSIAGAISIEAGGTLSAGNSPGTLTVASLNLSASANTVFELNAPGVVGGASNDHIVVNGVGAAGNLMLGGTLSASVASAGYYRLFDVTGGGSISGSFGALAIGAPSIVGPTGTVYVTPDGAPSQVNLAVIGSGQNLQFWDGIDQSGNSSVDGGAGGWSAVNTNWTGAPGQAAINAPWSGSVGVFQGAAGTVTVAGTQSFDTLQFNSDGYVLNGGALGFGVGDGGTINTAAGVTATIGSALIDGSGTNLTKVGAGALTLAGNNLYTGETRIAAGTLRLGAAGAIPQASGTTIDAGGTLDLGGLAHSIASLSLAGGTLGNGDLTGGITSSGGTIRGLGGAASVTTISGTTTIEGSNSYTGATVANGGTLIVNGSIGSPGLVVGAGATIGGSGTVPTTTVNGTLAPGHSPGTLTVNGDLMLGAGSLYLAEVQGTVSDRVDVSGTASLAGTLRVVPLGGAYLFSSSYSLLAAAGGLGGTRFGTVDTSASFGDGVTSAISYSATDVQLTLTPRPLAPIVEPVTPSASSMPSSWAGSGGNAAAVAAGIDAAVASGADPSSLFAIYNLPAAAIPRAVNQLSGEVHASPPAIANSAAGQFLRTLLDGAGAGRLSDTPGGPTGTASFTADLPSRQDGPGRGGFDPARFSLWGASFGSTGRNDGDRVVGSANRNLSDAHVGVGADIRLGTNTVAGVAVAGGQSRASLSGGLGKAEADVFQGGLYGRTTLGTVNLAGALGYARLDTDTTRAIPALGRTGVGASYATQAWSGRIEASQPVASWGGITLSPLAAFQAVRASSPAAIERDGSGVAPGTLTLARRSDITSRSELGLQVDASLLAGATPVTGFVRAAWAHYYQRDADLTAALNSLPGASFTAAGARPDRNAVLLAAGADIRLSQSVSLGMRVDSELSANILRVGGTAQIRVSF